MPSGNGSHAAESPPLTSEMADAVESGDARSIAHCVGGIVANDERVRVAIQEALDANSEQNATDPVANALAAIAAALANGSPTKT